jgi:hypothetical protein
MGQILSIADCRIQIADRNFGLLTVPIQFEVRQVLEVGNQTEGFVYSVDLLSRTARRNPVAVVQEA